jgi:hypothetical protein
MRKAFVKMKINCLKYYVGLNFKGKHILYLENVRRLLEIYTQRMIPKEAVREYFELWKVKTTALGILNGVE